MFKSQLTELYEYSCWAWDHVMDSAAQIPDAEYFQQRPLFWGSLHGLVVHGWAAERIWLDRLMGNSPTYFHGADDFADLASVRELWVPLRAGWRSYLANVSDDTLFGTMTYRATTGETNTVRVHGLLHHVMNHATEHRSQMTPLLAQLGQPTTALDYLYYQMELQL